MNIVIWMLAGAALGWIAYSFLGLSQVRGQMVSIVVGAIAGIMGGKLLAPMFIAAVPGEFSMATLMVAAGVAVAVLYAGNFIENRWGV